MQSWEFFHLLEAEFDGEVRKDLLKIEMFEYVVLKTNRFVGFSLQQKHNTLDFDF